MATKIQYITYIPQFTQSSDFPSGAFIFPQAAFAARFGPTETLHEDGNFAAHYNGQDCRRLAWIEGPDDHLCNGSEISVTEFAASQGMLNFCAVPLTVQEALDIAKAFSPARELDSHDPMDPTVPVTVTFSECYIGENGRIAQDVTTQPKE